MTPSQLRTLDEARRAAGHYVEEWKARGDQIVSPIGYGNEMVRVAKFTNVDAAHYVAKMHNVFLLVVNALIEAQRRLRDWERK